MNAVNRCKTCGTTDEGLFYKTNKTTCKNCISQKRKISIKTKLVANAVEQEAEQIAPVKDIKSTKKKMKVSNTTDTTIKNLIASQQKMLEHQQRQTDALFSLAEKLLEKINAPAINHSSSDSSSESQGVRPSPVSNRLIVSHTPRVRKNLAHYKDRLNNDL